MYVKNLTLRGFKSFASATTLRLEPGITCIVGPNGSGKSNVVDALAWVMGEQGAKSLRGGKMEDVIFAGTPGRPPLGRAEVSLTIDNSDGALPIAYTEVTLSRTMFRSGGSEYAINGTACRLLDVQELLSDSGIGREMHVVVGQGQLDSVLSATPEDRRGFIEEAAGVLKHRKRKERALRKMEAMEANLTRIQDLTAEIRRQLGPLGRQAETARRAAGIQVDVRDSRARLLADDLVQLVSTLQAELNDEAALLAARAEAETALAAARRELARHEATLAEAGPALTAAQQRWYALTSLRDRLEATATLAQERVRLLASVDDPAHHSGRAARDPKALAEQADQLRAQERQLSEELQTAREELNTTLVARRQAEEDLTLEQRRLADVARQIADHREGMATLTARVEAQRNRVEAAAVDLQRLREAAGSIHTRATEAQGEFTRLEGTVAVDEEGEEGLDSIYEAAAAALEEVALQLGALEDAERASERDRTSAQARVEALELTVRRNDGAQVLLDAAKGEAGHEPAAVTGVLGSLASLISVEGGYEAAVAAALGHLADAVAVQDLGSAQAALAHLRAIDGGRAALFVPPAGAHPSDGGSTHGAPPASGRWAADLVTCPDHLRTGLHHLLASVVVVPDADAAAAVVAGQPQLTAVTLDGDVYAPTYVLGGGRSGSSLLEIQAALDEARQRVIEATHRREQTQFAIAAARQRHTEQVVATEAALADLHASDARMAAVAEQLASWGGVLRAARAELARTEAAISTADNTLSADREALELLERRLRDASDNPIPPEPDTSARDQLDAAAVVARASETEARLRVGTLLERIRSLAARAESIEAAARDEQVARQQAQRLREQRAEQARVAHAVGVGATYAAATMAQAAGIAGAEREQVEALCRTSEQAVQQARRTVDALAEQVRELTDSVHRDEVLRAEQNLRIEALRTRALEELGTDPDVLMEEFGPHQPLADGSPYERGVQEKRLKVAERQLAQLGRINPLALEEYAALEERHTFLTEQLDDLKRSKKDLMEVVREVDHRVERVFADAFADTAVAFEAVFERLFPGGQGRLVLTDPENMLTTGIEVEARPPGKKIKRLSLLSGGERSLTAVALLLAIFKARPSPFYILDEVEAALDDTNLGRLITVLDELRDSSQLIIITHQKRTMEVADALYGVSMRGDGVTTVVSQRLRDARPA